MSCFFLAFGRRKTYMDQLAKAPFTPPRAFKQIRGGTMKRTSSYNRCGLLPHQTISHYYLCFVVSGTHMYCPSGNMNASSYFHDQRTRRKNNNYTSCQPRCSCSIKPVKPVHAQTNNIHCLESEMCSMHRTDASETIKLRHRRYNRLTFQGPFAAKFSLHLHIAVQIPDSPNSHR